MFKYEVGMRIGTQEGYYQVEGFCNGLAYGTEYLTDCEGNTYDNVSKYMTIFELDQCRKNYGLYR